MSDCFFCISLAMDMLKQPMRNLKIICACIVLLLCNGCNNDVFVEKFQTSKDEVVLENIGTEETVCFSTSEWGVFALLDEENRPLDGVLFDEEGRQAYTSLVKQYMKAFRFVFSDTETRFTVIREEEKVLKLVLEENGRTSPFPVKIGLYTESDYSEKYISVVILPKGGQR